MTTTANQIKKLQDELAAINAEIKMHNDQVVRLMAQKEAAMEVIKKEAEAKVSQYQAKGMKLELATPVVNITDDEINSMILKLLELE